MSEQELTPEQMVSLSEIMSRFMCGALAAKEIGRLMEEHAADMDRMEQAAETIEHLRGLLRECLEAWEGTGPGIVLDRIRAVVNERPS